MESMTLMIPSHIFLSASTADSESSRRGMGPLTNGRGEEEVENLSALKTLRYIFNSFAKQPCVEREHQWGSAEGSLEVCISD
jgi:hypothetical protein